MNIKKLQEDSARATYEFSDCSPGYVNAIRRYGLAKVPVMAVDTVEFRQNTSALYDEMLAHRIGLVPLTTDLKSYALPMADAAPSAATHVNLSLSAKGPCVVYSSDLKSDDATIKPVYGTIPLVKLTQGQSVDFVASACLGKGDDHAKYSPGLITFQYKPEIKVHNKEDALKRSLHKFPPGVVKDGKVDEALILSKPEHIDACKGVDSDVVDIKIPETPSSFLMIVESWGQLSSDDILREAINAFNDELENFEGELSKLS